MNCAGLTRLLDERGVGWLDDGALLAAAESHSSGCADCRAALQAVQALAADAVPPLPRAESDRLRPASPRAPQLRAPQRPSRVPLRVAIATAVAAGGIALAGAGWHALTRLEDSGGDGQALQSAGEPAQANATAAEPESPAAPGDAAADMIRFVEAEENRAVEAWSASILGALPDGEYFALLQVPPAYPAAAAERGLEGEAVAEFTITAEGDVRDVRIVRSSDPVFEPPTIDATLRKKYKPRVVDGRGVEVDGVRNVYRYRLQPATALPDEERQDPAGPAAAAAGAVDTDRSDLDMVQFSAVLERANECLAGGDLRCMELELDRIMATYTLSLTQTSRLWHFYGFLHHRRGRYELAIEAYRNAARAAAADPTYMNVYPLKIVAYIHYELGQYQQAMNAAAEHLRLTPNPRAVDYVLIDRLESLGAIQPAADRKEPPAG